MNEGIVALTKLLFNPNESFCVSHNKFGYSSVTMSDIERGVVTLISPNEKVASTTVDVASLKLMAINPIEGFRADKNCTAFRTFLVEMDSDKLGKQLSYVNSMGMPYSVCVYSGNKSLHFGITLDEDLGSIETYKFYAKYILNIMSQADQNTKNPSRSIRIPGAMRDGKKQALVSMGSRIPIGTLKDWLSKFPGEMPVQEEVKRAAKSVIVDMKDLAYALKPWMRKALYDGIRAGVQNGRNATWYAIGCELSLLGYGHTDIITILERFFVPEPDFSRYEWERTLKSASERFK